MLRWSLSWLCIVNKMLASLTQFQGCRGKSLLLVAILNKRNLPKIRGRVFNQDIDRQAERNSAQTIE